jgi:hypothetical protein
VVRERRSIAMAARIVVGAARTAAVPCARAGQRPRSRGHRRAGQCCDAIIVIWPIVICKDRPSGLAPSVIEMT